MRHHSDKTLNGTIARLIEKARHVAQKRRLRFDFHRNLDHQAVVMHPGLVHIAERALRLAGCPSSRLVSGYGHDAMIIAEKVPSTLIFVRSPDGLSQHPGMQMSPADVELAISSGLHFLKEITGFHAQSDSFRIRIAPSLSQKWDSKRLLRIAYASGER